MDKRRRALADQQRREHEERERKEREEQERKDKLREEQDRRRQAEYEKQIAKQREIEMVQFTLRSVEFSAICRHSLVGFFFLARRIILTKFGKYGIFWEFLKNYLLTTKTWIYEGFWFCGGGVSISKGSSNNS